MYAELGRPVIRNCAPYIAVEAQLMLDPTLPSWPVLTDLIIRQYVSENDANLDSLLSQLASPHYTNSQEPEDNHLDP